MPPWSRLASRDLSAMIRIPRARHDGGICFLNVRFGTGDSLENILGGGLEAFKGGLPAVYSALES